MIPYHFISTLLNASFDFDVTVANDVAIDVAKCALSGKVMQWSPCLEVRTLTNGNRRYIMKLNDYDVIGKPSRRSAVPWDTTGRHDVWRETRRFVFPPDCSTPIIFLYSSYQFYEVINNISSGQEVENANSWRTTKGMTLKMMDGQTTDL